jgi:hypothetical protein
MGRAASIVKKVDSQGVEGYRASDPKEKSRFVIEEAEEDLEETQKVSPFNRGRESPRESRGP